MVTPQMAEKKEAAQIRTDQGGARAHIATWHGLGSSRSAEVALEGAGKRRCLQGGEEENPNIQKGEAMVSCLYWARHCLGAFREESFHCQQFEVFSFDGWQDDLPIDQERAMDVAYLELRINQTSQHPDQ